MRVYNEAPVSLHLDLTAPKIISWDSTEFKSRVKFLSSRDWAAYATTIKHLGILQVSDVLLAGKRSGCAHKIYPIIVDFDALPGQYDIIKFTIDSTVYIVAKYSDIPDDVVYKTFKGNKTLPIDTADMSENHNCTISSCVDNSITLHDYSWAFGAWDKTNKTMTGIVDITPDINTTNIILDQEGYMYFM